MATDDNKALVRYVEEVLNNKNLALIDELFASTFIDHDSSMPEAKGPAGVKRFAAMAHASFPDLHFTIEDMVAEGDKDRSLIFRSAQGAQGSCVAIFKVGGGTFHDRT
jgi:predicted ester cyclase